MSAAPDQRGDQRGDQPGNPPGNPPSGTAPDAGPPATALIAEDEPLLARALRRQLAALWPSLHIVAQAEDGPSAVAMALAKRPDILFLDIQMPGATGLEAAAEIADDWEGTEPPLVVFVTAYDRYAVMAFERAAVDYLMKPVTPERLAQTVARLKGQLAQRAERAQRLAAEAAAPLPALAPHAPAAPGRPGAGAAAEFVRQVQEAALHLATAPGGLGAGGQAGSEPPHRDGGESEGAPPERIRVIRAAEGTRVRMIPLAEVVLFEAADKYVSVITEQGGNALIRMSLRELAGRLEGVEFTQVHRSVLVNAERIAGAERDEAGHYWLTLRGLGRPLKVSRAFSHLFKPM